MSDPFTENPSPLDDPRAVAIAASVAAEGGPATEKVQVDFFAPVPDITTMLPDGISFVTHKKMNEGDRRKYLAAINRDLKIQKGTGDAIMRLASGEERTALLKCAITGWNLIRGGQPWPFNAHNLAAFLEQAPVDILELVEADVRKNNKWLIADATVEDIDKQIEELQEMRQEIIDRESGNAGSAN